LFLLVILLNVESKLMLFLFVGWAAVVALRLGFSRHDYTHTTQAYTLLLVVALGLGSRKFVWAPVGVVVGCAAAVIATSAGYLTLINPWNLALHSKAAVEAAVSEKYRSELLGEARTTGKIYYQLTPQVLDAIGTKPVHIDPKDANVAWAYGLNWDPVPVFQSYSAFTPALDRINATALVSPDGPKDVLRALPTAIDSRNPLWETPLYTQALVCNYRPGVQSARWLVLTRTSERCGSADVKLGATRFSAGDTVTVPPSPGKNYMVVASFSLSNSSLNLIATEVFKPLAPVYVTIDGHRFRLPRAHENGPLILKLPASVGWPARFGGDTNAHSFTVTESGRVAFAAILVHPVS
jgi:hypothetical protein